MRAHRSTIDLRQQPPARRAPRAAAERARRASPSRARTTARSRASARSEIEEALKAGELPGLVATSSLELGIDMGAVDLVCQVESPGSVARGLQRVGRAGHQVGEPSIGRIFPKFRGDLLECAVVARRMELGLIEETRVPRNPLDVLAQQIVAICGEGPVAGRRAVRAGAPRLPLPRAVARPVRRRARHARRAATRPTSSPSCGRASSGTASRARVRARDGAIRIAIANAGTIPDRGLFGVYLVDGSGARRRARRGDGLRGARGRGVPARRQLVADRGDHARPRDRLARAGRARQDPVLEGRPGRPAGRARRAPSARSAASSRCCPTTPPRRG